MTPLQSLHVALWVRVGVGVGGVPPAAASGAMPLHHQGAYWSNDLHGLHGTLFWPCGCTPSVCLGSAGPDCPQVGAVSGWHLALCHTVLSLPVALVFPRVPNPMAPWLQSASERCLPSLGWAVSGSLCSKEPRPFDLLRPALVSTSPLSDQSAALAAHGSLHSGKDKAGVRASWGRGSPLGLVGAPRPFSPSILMSQSCKGDNEIPGNWTSFSPQCGWHHSWHTCGHGCTPRPCQPQLEVSVTLCVCVPCLVPTETSRVHPSPGT